MVRTDEKPGVLLNLSADKIIPKVKEELKRQDIHFTRMKPFVGLVKENPRKALSVLTITGKNGDYPKEFWSSMISYLPTNIKSRLKRVFFKRITRLPVTAVIELRYELSRWLKNNLAETLKFDNTLGWAVYDHISKCILDGGPNATQSGLGDITQNGEAIIRSRRTFSHATNGPVGICTQALFQAIPDENNKANSLLPYSIKSRIEHLFTAPSEGSDHAIAITTSNLDWIMLIDPVWAKEWLIPILDLKHPSAEPAWNGYLQHDSIPSIAVAEPIKPYFLSLIPWIEHLSWKQDFSLRASQLFGLMRIFRPDEPSSPSRNEMRSILRSLSNEARSRFISWLKFVGLDNKNGWINHVVPLIKNDWPKERQYRTTDSVKAWLNLLNDTGASFPAVYNVVKTFLVSIETLDYLLYQFTEEVQNNKPITILFPEMTLDLMNKITPHTIINRPSELQKILALIEEVEPSLTTDSRYIRLIEIVEKN